MIIQPIEFWFSCGQLCLRNVKLNALVLDAHRPGPSPATLVPELPADVDVVYAVEPAAAGTKRSLAVLPEALRYVASSAYDRRYIAIDGSFDSYLGKFSGKTRQTWRRKVAKLSRAGGGRICWREFRRPDEMAEFHSAACAVVATTYQKKLYDTGVPESPAFRDQLRRAAASDGIRGYVLYMNERPIAFNYCYALGDALVTSKLGYDPAYAQLSPGAVLLHLILESLFRHDRFRRLDFGRGEFAYKEHYATDKLSSIDTFYFPRTAGNLGFAAAHFGTALLSKSASTAFAAIGVKDAAKRLLRDIAVRRRGGGRADSLNQEHQP